MSSYIWHLQFHRIVCWGGVYFQAVSKNIFMVWYHVQQTPGKNNKTLTSALENSFSLLLQQNAIFAYRSHAHVIAQVYKRSCRETGLFKMALGGHCSYWMMHSWNFNSLCWSVCRWVNRSCSSWLYLFVDISRAALLFIWWSWYYYYKQ